MKILLSVLVICILHLIYTSYLTLLFAKMIMPGVIFCRIGSLLHHYHQSHIYSLQSNNAFKMLLNCKDYSELKEVWYCNTSTFQSTHRLHTAFYQRINLLVFKATICGHAPDNLILEKQISFVLSWCLIQ